MSLLFARSIKFIIIVSISTTLFLFKLDIQQLFQWEIISLIIFGILSLSLYKLRNSLRLDDAKVQIQFVDA